MNPNQLVTLLDLAALKGTDTTEGILDIVQTLVPEIGIIPGRTIAGNGFMLPVKTGRPGAGFRKANAGKALDGKSSYDKYPVNCYIASMQLEVDARIADAHPFGRDAFLAEEMDGGARTLAENLGEQIYYGTSADDEGFLGYREFLTDENGAVLDSLVLDAGGTGDNLTSVYLTNIGGAHGIKWVYGGNGSFNDQEAWKSEKLRDANGNAYPGYGNALDFWIGLQLSPNSVVRIANVDTTEDESATGQLTDELIARAVKRFPRGFRPNQIFMNKDAKFVLQKNRSATMSNGNAKVIGDVQGSERGTWAPEPTSSSNLPLVETDCLLTGEEQAA